ncbi:MAG: DegT/DnrJ/EryC1/StrS family aminotransferase [Bacteroidia bacterium]
MTGYYFPGLIDTARLPKLKSDKTRFNLNSGSNAVRLILRSFNLKKGAVVALPVYVCDSLKEAVIKEGFQPFYLDLADAETFWTDYNEKAILESSAAAVILVHLYGCIHPDNERIISFCREKNIFLIHDTAQSYGVDESKLGYGNILYSFGPGKSSTAAGGGIIKNMDEGFYKKNVSAPPVFSNLRARLFMKSRIYGATYSLADRIGWRIINRIHEPDGLYTMTSVQRNAAEYVLKLVPDKKEERAKRYNLLKRAVIGHKYLKIPFESNNECSFKLVLYVNGDNMERFTAYLEQHKVPYHCLYRAIKLGNENIEKLPNYKNAAPRIIEISCEACLALSEIERVAGILKKFN